MPGWNGPRLLQWNWGCGNARTRRGIVPTSAPRTNCYLGWRKESTPSPVLHAAAWERACWRRFVGEPTGSNRYYRTDDRTSEDFSAPSLSTPSYMRWSATG